MNHEQIERSRREKDAIFKNSPNSPLTESQRVDFDGLDYYDYNPDLSFTTTVERFEVQDMLQVMTTTNEIRNYRRYGEFTFTVDGEEARLTIFETPHGFFLPFVDANTETYPAGRYLDLEPETNGVFRIDFNQAYNPLCALNDGWSCPLTPAENRLGVAIRAGEKIPTGKWVGK